MGKGIYQLANDKGKILKKKVNVNRLKPFKRQLSECNPDSAGEPPQKKPGKAEDPDVTTGLSEDFAKWGSSV